MCPPDARSDGGTAATPDEQTLPATDLDEQAVYRAVRYAVEDAILAVLGTLLLLGVALVLVAAGAQVATRGTPTGLAIGGALVLYGVYIAAVTLEVIPSVREFL
jgi:hypothetical protein